MTKTKSTLPADVEEKIEARLARARELRVEAVARTGRDPRQHDDADHIDPELLEELVRHSRIVGLRHLNVDALRAVREKSRKRLRALSSRGLLRGKKTTELALSFSHEELATILREDAEAAEAKSRAMIARREQAEVAQLARQTIADEDKARYQEREAAAREEAARRLGVSS